tara:strand:- start:1165 stop:2073 length:909 start_codon:yes stop_codon:yes gene_type:complete
MFTIFEVIKQFKTKKNMSNNALDAILSQYEKAQNSGNSSNKMTSEERLKKYFAAILPKDEKQGQRTLRILPTSDGSSPFKEVWYHEMQVDGKWVKLYDPGANDNERSPLTEVYEALTSTGKDSDRQLASQYRSRKFYIVKVVDRDNEADGVKFWRFKHNYKNEGILDKIIPIFRTKGDITEPEKGRDIILELTKAKANNGNQYTVVQTVMFDDPSPVHEDKETSDVWVNDPSTLHDVYAKKPVEYLEAVANGETPKWDTVTGKYVFGDSSQGEVSFGGQSQKEEVKKTDPQSKDSASDDMPF